MSWMTESSRTRAKQTRTSSAPLEVSVDDWLRLERPLLLTCGACGKNGRYHVGTVLIDPVVGRKAKDIGEAVGFTAYLRCKKCDAGGPWKLPPDTLVRIMALSIVAMEDPVAVPLVFGSIGTFDGHRFRYATDGEAHLKRLIEREPDRAFLWVRLGNLYKKAGAADRCRPAYERALELDPVDLEAHSMLGQHRFESGATLDAVPHFHAVLRHARDAKHVDIELRRELVHSAILFLLDARAATDGAFDLFPTADPAELKKGPDGEPVVVELREFDLGSDEGRDEVVELFLGEPGRRDRGWFRSRRRRRPRDRDEVAGEVLQRSGAAVTRNAPCPCGSGRKYKKCCGTAGLRYVPSHQAGDPRV